MLYCQFFMVRRETISVVIVVALLCMSYIILCQCVEKGESQVLNWRPVIVQGLEVEIRCSEVGPGSNEETFLSGEISKKISYVQIGTTL